MVLDSQSAPVLGARLLLTNELRLRRAARGSGEHRRERRWGRGDHLGRSGTIVVPMRLDRAPASQLLNVIGQHYESSGSRIDLYSASLSSEEL